MSDIEIKERVKNNGMRIVTVDMPAVKSVTVLAMAGIGSRYEEDETAGISHFLEHLPFKGTKNYATSLDIAKAVDGVGGKHNAFTSKEYTGYWVQLAAEKIDTALDVVSDLLLTPRLREEDIGREKGVIVEEINMYEDEPRWKVSEVFDELVFKDSHLARPVIGYPSTVTSFSRDDFMHHYDRWYNRENIVVGVVGGLSEIDNGEESLIERVDSFFQKGEERTGGGVRDMDWQEQTKPRVRVYQKPTEQAHFHLGVPGVSRSDERRYVLQVLTTLLGGNSSSRLFNEIREKRGLAYYAYASADVFADTGSLYALEGVTVDKIDEAIQVTLNEFERVREDITPEEVERAKEYVIGKTILDMEDSSSMANLVVKRAVLENVVEGVDEVLERIRGVELNEVQALAEELLDFEKLNLAVVGPYESEERFVKLLE